MYPPSDLEPKNIYVPLKRMAPFQGDAARTVGNPTISGRLLWASTDETSLCPSLGGSASAGFSWSAAGGTREVLHQCIRSDSQLEPP